MLDSIHRLNRDWPNIFDALRAAHANLEFYLMRCRSTVIRERYLPFKMSVRLRVFTVLHRDGQFWPVRFEKQFLRKFYLLFREAICSLVCSEMHQ